MQLMRKFEDKAGQLYGQQKIKGFCHLYIGQEACVAGAVSALEKGDKYITAYRDHAHPLALGTSPNAVMAELFAKATGCSKGKGGSMHMFDKEVGFMGGHGIVGGAGADGRRHCLCREVQQDRQALHLLYGRWRRAPGCPARSLQHGHAVEAAGHLRD